MSFQISVTLSMATPNHTGTSHSLFILLGIPGLEDQHIWISRPFFISYLVAVLGNSLLVFIVVTECSLHEPMYFFLCMLAVVDLILSTTTVPKALAVFWFHAGEISLDGCATQIFFIHATFIAESGILLAMAFDCYVAICDPLRYVRVPCCEVIIRVGLVVVLRSFSVILPDVFLVKRLPLCHSNVLPHTYCEHMAVAKFACANIRVNVWYGLSALLSTAMIDALHIWVSYTFILNAVFRLPSRGAWQKALGTCSSHICAILVFYIPIAVSSLTHCFGNHVPPHIHILLAKCYLLIPPVLNPIVYAVHTKQIRERLLHILKSLWRILRDKLSK
uniref:G-protein coupled receptors family 1 profile domain-containing protein n=1 Tax=Monodon monoceros TaxID=40151 RepID=A0A8C6C8H6_MONMO